MSLRCLSILFFFLVNAPAHARVLMSRALPATPIIAIEGDFDPLTRNHERFIEGMLRLHPHSSILLVPRSEKKLEHLLPLELREKFIASRYQNHPRVLYPSASLKATKVRDFNGSKAMIKTISAPELDSYSAKIRAKIAQAWLNSGSADLLPAERMRIQGFVSDEVLNSRAYLGYSPLLPDGAPKVMKDYIKAKLMNRIGLNRAMRERYLSRIPVPELKTYTRSDGSVYRVLKTVGRGSLARAYLVEGPDGRLAVLKLLHDHAKSMDLKLSKVSADFLEKHSKIPVAKVFWVEPDGSASLNEYIEGTLLSSHPDLSAIKQKLLPQILQMHQEGLRIFDESGFNLDVVMDNFIVEKGTDRLVLIDTIPRTRKWELPRKLNRLFSDLWGVTPELRSTRSSCFFKAVRRAFED